MLQVPEKGSREHIKLWLAGRDPNERYHWSASADCACGQYSREHYGADFSWLGHKDCPPALAELNLHARGPATAAHYPYTTTADHTFGALYDRVCKAWA